MEPTDKPDGFISNTDEGDIPATRWVISGEEASPKDPPRFSLSHPILRTPRPPTPCVSPGVHRCLLLGVRQKNWGGKNVEADVESAGMGYPDGRHGGIGLARWTSGGRSNQRGRWVKALLVRCLPGCGS